MSSLLLFPQKSQEDALRVSEEKSVAKEMAWYTTPFLQAISKFGITFITESRI